MPSDDGVMDCNHPLWSENLITTTLVILQLKLNLILWKVYIFTSDTTVHNSKYYKLIVRGYVFRLLMEPFSGQL